MTRYRKTNPLYRANRSGEVVGTILAVAGLVVLMLLAGWYDSLF